GSRVLVEVGHQRLALALGNGNRHDLVLEAALGDGGRCPALALRGEFVLRLPRHAVAVGDLLGGAAHLIAAERIGDQRQRAVDQLRFAEPPSHLRAGEQVGLDRHVLVAAGDNHLRLAGAQLLDGAVDGLQAGPAEPVHVERRGRLGKTGLQCRQAGVEGILAYLADATEDDLVNHRRGNAGTVHRGPDCRRPQVRRRGVLERAGKLADGGADAPRDDDSPSVARHGVILSRDAGATRRPDSVRSRYPSPPIRRTRWRCRPPPRCRLTPTPTLDQARGDLPRGAYLTTPAGDLDSGDIRICPGRTARAPSITTRTARSMTARRSTALTQQKL